MQLSQEEAEYFFSLFKPLLVYTNQQFKLIEELKKPEDVENLSLEETAQVRNKLYQNPELFEQYINKNQARLTSEDREIIQSWKNFLQGTFFIFRYLKKYTIFLSQEQPYKAYGVVSLHSSFPEMFGSSLPIIVKTVLLPFKNQIVSDGIFQGSNIYFGRNFRESLKEIYNESKAQFGIITSLTAGQSEIIISDPVKLKNYLKNQKSRSLNQQKIYELRDKSEELKIVYYQEMGKINVRKYRKSWRELGLSNMWFGILETVPIASGKTQADLKKNLKQILTPQQIKLVYMFHLKER